MLARWRIRYKLLVGVVMLLLIVAMLAFSSFQGVYSYRGLARSISNRAAELPLSADLAESVSELNSTLAEVRRADAGSPWILREEFKTNLMRVRDSLRRYREQLSRTERSGFQIDDDSREWEAVAKIEESLTRIDQLNSSEAWLFDQLEVTAMQREVEAIKSLANELPTYLQQRMHGFAGDVKVHYRTWIVLAWISTILAVSMLAMFVWCFYVWVFAPLRVLIHGSRRVAAGDYQHRIQLTTRDEMAELAGALNAMTSNFQEIRDDLNQQVRLRTKEVVRSEQLASVGFLAAGVAHEINNPLASIAWSAESLELRLHDIIQEDDEKPDGEHCEEIALLRDYLRRIQDEAFRCKEITERLLDFSRMGDMEKQETDLSHLVGDVIDMVRHLGRYREKNVEFEYDEAVYAPVNAQEVKQVVLNLITNALDSLDCGGVVRVRVGQKNGAAELSVQDNGCGMTEEVLEHLFEPFFTRRRDGKGTGLGLSITWQIVNDHGGKIMASSDGPGRGSQFRVTFPLAEHEQKRQRQLQAA
ncbi:MAG: HAMP domain-containing histidine kinase [Planctomycetes bacterium]|nr:HAMP domain-containing histidine kinase [Planctomycetota bacterium]